MQKERLLHEMAEEIRGCTKCGLCATRTNGVPGEGSPTARIMFVGEGPGEKEDLAGRPFVGAAGKMLNSLLERAGIAREDVFITNIVKCRPPANRVPLLEEVNACNDYLMGQIAIIEPKFICPLGGSSLGTLLGPDLKITTARCRVFRKSGILYIPLYHPAAALHNGSLQSTLQADVMVLKELINRPIREDEITDLTPAIYRKEEPAPRKSSAIRKAVPEVGDATRTSTPPPTTHNEARTENLSLF